MILIDRTRALCATALPMMQCTVNLSCRAESLNPSGRIPSRKSVVLEGLSRFGTALPAIMNGL